MHNTFINTVFLRGTARMDKKMESHPKGHQEGNRAHLVV